MFIQTRIEQPGQATDTVVTQLRKGKVLEGLAGKPVNFEGVPLWFDAALVLLLLLLQQMLLLLTLLLDQLLLHSTPSATSRIVA